MRAFLLCFVVLFAMVFTTEAMTSRKHLLKGQDDVEPQSLLLGRESL